jgi:transposase
VIESTGHYHLLPSLMLTEAGYRVNCINPIITKRYQQSSIRNAKTDPIDAARLAQIGFLEPNLPVFSADRASLEARKLVSYLGKLERLRQQLRDSLSQVKAMAGMTSISVTLRPTEAALKKIELQIEALKERICQLAPAEAKALADGIHGLSEEKVAVIFAAVASKQFTSRDQLTAFVGLDVAPRQSGRWLGRGRLSKRGDPYLRKVLFQIAWGLKQHNVTYKAHYARLRARGMNYVTTMIILARKFLRLLFAYYWKRSCPQPTI